MFTSNETTETLPLQGLSPKENVLLELRQVCAGVVEDHDTIIMGVASLHTLVEKKRAECFDLGISTQAVNDVIDGYRRQS